MNQTNIAILLGVFVRILMGVCSGWLIAHGVSDGSVEALSGAIVAVLVPIVWQYVSSIKLLNTEPPGKGE